MASDESSTLIELRCPRALFGYVDLDRRTVEVKCKRRACGADRGAIVLHTISLDTGQVVDNKRFREPNPRKG